MSTTPPELVDDLRQVGVRIRSLWDLVETDEPYPQAIAVLIRWLDDLDSRPATTEREWLRDGLVRALTVPEARPQAARSIVRQFAIISNESELGPRWVLGNALGVVTDATVCSPFLELLTNRGLGRSRELMFAAIPRLADSNPEVIKVCRSLLDDESVVRFAVQALGDARAREARDDISVLKGHPNKRVRKAVMHALRQLS